MEFPFGHGHHSHATHHHHRRDDEETGDYPPPPPPPGNTFSTPPPPSFYGGADELPPPPPPPHHEATTQVFHTAHVSHRPVSQDLNNFSDFPPPPPPPRPHPEVSPYGTATSVLDHVSHVVGHRHQEAHHSHSPNFASSVHHVGHVSHHVGSGLSNKQTVRVVTKAAPDYSLTIRYGKVVLAPSDPRDEYQHWYKDEKYSTKVKDEEGCPGFSLVNKVTGEAIKHSIGDTHPVRLIPYNPDYLDESILWTESRDLGDGYRAVRMVNNVRLNVDAYHGDKKSGGVHDGTTIVLWKWNKGDNQRWKILPY